ncbi:MAG: hypothetical protein GY782_07630, partial [Gammaproteobacteria bacterium]|nr:hypothetical protein [Gammaproteobacteria bacterium]
MNFQTKGAQTVDAIKKFGVTSLAKLAAKTGHSKSSTHRQLKKVEQRCNYPGAEFFETTAGLTWLRRLVIGVV